MVARVEAVRCDGPAAAWCGIVTVSHDADFISCRVQMKVCDMLSISWQRDEDAKPLETCDSYLVIASPCLGFTSKEGVDVSTMVNATCGLFI